MKTNQGKILRANVAVAQKAFDDMESAKMSLATARLNSALKFGASPSEALDCVAEFNLDIDTLASILAYGHAEKTKFEWTMEIEAWKQAQASTPALVDVAHLDVVGWWNDKNGKVGTYAR